MKETIQLWTLLSKLNFLLVSVTIIYTNDQGCIVLAYNLVNHSYTKHINIKHHFIHKYIEYGKIKLKYIPTKEMLADVFTKEVPYKALVRSRQ